MAFKLLKLNELAGDVYIYIYIYIYNSYNSHLM